MEPSIRAFDTSPPFEIHRFFTMIPETSSNVPVLLLLEAKSKY